MQSNKVLLAALLAAKKAQDNPAIGELRHDYENDLAAQRSAVQEIREAFSAYQASEEGREESRLNEVTNRATAWFTENRDQFKGDTGPTGEVGPAGPCGPAGLAGVDGRDGVDGGVGPRGPRGPSGERGLQGRAGLPGPKGDKGDTGDVGPMPKHEWQGTKLRFEQKPGVWGEYVDLEGPRGRDGKRGTITLAPDQGTGGGGTGEARQEVFIGAAPAINYPALAFVARQVDGQTVYQMRVNV